MRQTELVNVVESRIDQYNDELSYVLTVAECAVMFEVSPRTVSKDCVEGRLYAKKVYASPYNDKAGFWLIPYSAARDQYKRG